VARARWELTVRERQLRVVMGSLGNLGTTLREEETRRGGGAMLGGRSCNNNGNNNDDARDGKGADASSSKRTKLAQKGNKKKPTIEGVGDNISDDGDNP
jgi:hypothetical protein